MKLQSSEPGSSKPTHLDDADFKTLPSNAAELEQFEAFMLLKIEMLRARGSLLPFDGDIEKLVSL